MTWYNASTLLYGLLLLTLSHVPISAGANFSVCRQSIVQHSNQSYIDEFLYKGNIRGLKEGAPRPLTLTVNGCNTLCGSSPELNHPFDAFQILTTWVLPSITLCFLLPYESLSKKTSQNWLAFVFWIGSPAAAFTAIIFDVYLIKKCHDLSDDRIEYSKDVCYVLSCINQYHWPELEGVFQEHRDEALLHGLFRPLVLAENDSDAEDLRAMLGLLAFQLRINRKKGVVPMIVSLLWFLIAFILSIVLAFANLGDYSTAHSLALGLLLSWIPVLVVLSIVDRNPTGSTRARELLERWLFNCHVHRQRQNAPPTEHYWQKGNRCDLRLGDFCGQGRLPGYRGTVWAIVSSMEKYASAKYKEPRKIFTPVTQKFVENGPRNPNLFEDVLNDLPQKRGTRPAQWWTIWILGLVIPNLSIYLCLLVGFNTPTVGFGCRSLSYMVYSIMISVTWLLYGVKREPPKLVVRLCQTISCIAVISLLAIIFFQMANALRLCNCISSTLGTSSYGGYVTLEGASYFREHFHVAKYWAPAASLGLFNGVVLVMIAFRQWQRTAPLRKTNEDHQCDIPRFITLDWLT